MEIQEIKQRLNILTVLSSYGLVPDKHCQINCPFHEDNTPSLKIYSETNSFHCFGCGATGDVIEFIQLKEKTDKHSAILKAKAMVGETPIVISKPKHEAGVKSIELKSEINPKPIISKLFTHFINGLKSNLVVKPKDYLKKRNLNPGALELGYNSGQFHHRGKLPKRDLQSCIELGLLIEYKGYTPNGKEATYTPFAKDCIIFPLKDKESRIISIYGRSIKEGSHSKHFYLKNRTGLYPGYPSMETNTLILTEAIIDAATLFS